MVHQEPLVLLPHENKNRMVTLLSQLQIHHQLCVGCTQSEELVSLPFDKKQHFLNYLVSIYSICALFKQEGLSEGIQLISAFLKSLTDDSTTTDDTGVNKQASPDAAGSNE